MPGRMVQVQRTDTIAFDVGDSAVHMNTWTLEQFRCIPKTLDSVPPGTQTAVIIPAADDEELHDSGYRCMSLVFFGTVDGQKKMLGRSQYGHDHIQIFPNPQDATGPREPVKASGYERVEMDCLPGSGLVQFWLQNNGLDNGYRLFSTADLRPAKAGNDAVKVDLHSDQLKDVKRKMLEWGRHFGKDVLAVALDAALEEL